MLPFWLLYILAVAGMLVFGRARGGTERAAWWCTLAFFCVAIGVRHEVGGDWYNYLQHYWAVAHTSFRYAVEYSDPGYYVLNWFVAEVGGDIYWLNSACALILIVGLGVFCRAQPLPWTGLAVSVPYLIVVVAMGYTRQATALGWALIGLTFLGKQKTLPFVVTVLIGATFHRSAVLLLPIAALAASKSRLWTWLWVGITTGLGAQLLLLEDTEQLWNTYVEKQMQSEGGEIRVAMNAVPAVLFLVWRGHLTDKPGEARLWTWLSLFALACVALVPFASTAVDRVALYFIPIQVFVFARIHRAAKGEGSRNIVAVAIVGYYAAVEYVWLNYASHASNWVPYQVMPFQLIP